MIVKFETANLARKRGFDEATQWYYDNKVLKLLPQGKEINSFHWNRYEEMGCVAAPTHHELKIWLEQRNRYISIQPEFYKTGINWNWQVLWYNTNKDKKGLYRGTGWYGDNGEYPTSDSAMESALLMGVHLVKELCIYSNMSDLREYWNTTYEELREMIDSIDPMEFGEWSFLDLTENQLDLLEKKRNEKG